jgi:hypothetical protein
MELNLCVYNSFRFAVVNRWLGLLPGHTRVVTGRGSAMLQRKGSGGVPLHIYRSTPWRRGIHKCLSAFTSRMVYPLHWRGAVLIHIYRYMPWRTVRPEHIVGELTCCANRVHNEGGGPIHHMYNTERYWRKSNRLTPFSIGFSRKSNRLTPISIGFSRKSSRLTPISIGFTRKSSRLTPISIGFSRKSNRLTPISIGFSRKSNRLTPFSIGFMAPHIPFDSQMGWRKASIICPPLPIVLLTLGLNQRSCFLVFYVLFYLL